MKTISFLASATIIISSALSATGVGVNAQSPNKTNYCGTKRTSWLVSDRTFGPACKVHDECLQSGTDRNICRKRFKSVMLDICNSIPEGKEKKLRFWTNGERRSICFKKASAYAWGVGIRDIIIED